MTTARDRILARIRAAARPDSVAAPAGAPVLPPLGDSMTATFESAARRAEADVIHAASRADLPATIAAALGDADRLVALAGTTPASLDWQAAGIRTTRERHDVAVAEGLCGIAESGTVVVLSSTTPLAPVLLTDRLFLVLARDTIVDGMEKAFALVRDAVGDTPPRGVVLVTGPSRTADVEQTMQLGAHGPRRLTIIVVDD